MLSPRQMFSACDQRVLLSGDYSDLTITCGSDVYKVHKVVVCLRSKFFAKAVSFPVGKEAAESKIDLPDDDPAIIKLLIQYLYEAEYDPCIQIGIGNIMSPYNEWVNGYTPVFPHSCPVAPQCYEKICPHHICGRDECKNDCKFWECNQCHDSPYATFVTGDNTQLLTHVKMYQIGDKYDVIGLKGFAEKKFQVACEVFWNDTAFVAAARLAFETTVEHDLGLRRLVRQTISDHIEIIMKQDIMAFMDQNLKFTNELLMDKVVSCYNLKKAA